MAGLGRQRRKDSGRTRSIALRLAGLLVLATSWGCTGRPASDRAEDPPTGAQSLIASMAPAAGRATFMSPAASSASASPSVSYVPLVPIVGFWSGLRSLERSELASLLSGGRPPAGLGFGRIAVAAPDAEGLARALGIEIHASVRRASPADVLAMVRADPAALGVVRAEAVGPGVRALAVGGFSLFGAGRIKDATYWPLSVRSTTPSAFDNAGMWTLTAGGDVNLDRSVYSFSIRRSRGVDYPWNGGTARIAGLTCCGFQGNSLVMARRSGNGGSFRTLLSGSDISIVNLEGMASQDFVYRQDGFTFDVDPALLAGLRNAGIDAVSLANNHTLDAGPQAITQTRRELDSLGVAYAGAGADLAAASQPAWLSAAGLRVAFLAYDAPQQGNWARVGRAGAAPFQIDAVTADIRAARAAGADFVIVMPHWGSEYTLYVSREQRRQAEAMVAAGADVILGSHSHYAGGMQTFVKPAGDRALVVYSLGNLLFDFSYDQRTLQGVVYELTFQGTRLVQVEMNPTVMVDHSQVNLLDPAADGSATIQQIRSASDGEPSW